MDSFRRKFRGNYDLLLMDDIQILSKGEGVQEEFFHTFNDLYNKNTLIVLCSDEKPSSIPRLEERIKTRLEGGLIADVSYPCQETRLAILKSKARKKGLILSGASLDKITKAVKDPLERWREFLNKIKIMIELHGGNLSLNAVEKVLKGIKKELSIDEIKKETAKAFALSVEDLSSLSRKKPIVTARQTAMYLVRMYLKKSLTEISHAFGKKDHTTVLNSLKKVENLKKKDPEFKRTLELLQKNIHIYETGEF